jgi:excisionase family DNA binding protein
MDQSCPSEIPADPGLSGLLTTREVATLLRVSQRTVQDWVRTGQLAAVRYGRLVRLRQADVVAFGVKMPRHEA